jgi:hypothetical protein
MLNQMELSGNVSVEIIEDTEYLAAMN